MRRCAVEEDTFASGLNHVLYGGKRAGIVVHNHPFRFQLRTDAVVKYNRYVVVQQLLIVVVLLRVLAREAMTPQTRAARKEWTILTSCS